MKYVKVKINKTRNADSTQTNFVYPAAYDAKLFNIVCYENKGNSIEYAVAITGDDFIESEGLSELNLGQSMVFIDDFTMSDKDLDESSLIQKGKTKIMISNNRKKLLGK